MAETRKSVKEIIKSLLVDEKSLENLENDAKKTSDLLKLYYNLSITNQAEKLNQRQPVFVALAGNIANAKVYEELDYASKLMAIELFAKLQPGVDSLQNHTEVYMERYNNLVDKVKFIDAESLFGEDSSTGSNDLAESLSFMKKAEPKEVVKPLEKPKVFDAPKVVASQKSKNQEAPSGGDAENVTTKVITAVAKPEGMTKEWLMSNFGDHWSKISTRYRREVERSPKSSIFSDPFVYYITKQLVYPNVDVPTSFVNKQSYDVILNRDFGMDFYGWDDKSIDIAFHKNAASVRLNSTPFYTESMEGSQIRIRDGDPKDPQSILAIMDSDVAFAKVAGKLKTDIAIMKQEKVISTDEERIKDLNKNISTATGHYKIMMNFFNLRDEKYFNDIKLKMTGEEQKAFFNAVNSEKEEKARKEKKKTSSRKGATKLSDSKVKQLVEMKKTEAYIAQNTGSWILMSAKDVNGLNMSVTISEKKSKKLATLISETGILDSLLHGLARKTVVEVAVEVKQNEAKEDIYIQKRQEISYDLKKALDMRLRLTTAKNNLKKKLDADENKDKKMEKKLKNIEFQLKKVTLESNIYEAKDKAYHTFMIEHLNSLSSNAALYNMLVANKMTDCSTSNNFYWVSMGIDERYTAVNAILDEIEAMFDKPKYNFNDLKKITKFPDLDTFCKTKDVLVGMSSKVGDVTSHNKFRSTMAKAANVCVILRPSLTKQKNDTKVSSSGIYLKMAFIFGLIRSSTGVTAMARPISIKTLFENSVGANADIANAINFSMAAGRKKKPEKKVPKAGAK